MSHISRSKDVKKTKRKENPLSLVDILEYYDLHNKLIEQNLKKVDWNHILEILEAVCAV